MSAGLWFENDIAAELLSLSMSDCGSSSDTPRIRFPQQRVLAKMPEQKFFRDVMLFLKFFLSFWISWLVQNLTTKPFSPAKKRKCKHGADKPHSLSSSLLKVDKCLYAFVVAILILEGVLIMKITRRLVRMESFISEFRDFSGSARLVWSRQIFECLRFEWTSRCHISIRTSVVELSVLPHQQKIFNHKRLCGQAPIIVCATKSTCCASATI